MKRALDVIVAVIAGIVCHTGFLTAVGLMAFGLAEGLQGGIGRIPAPWATGVNLLLAAQFPLLHSAFLTRRGSGVLRSAVPGRRGGPLTITTFVIITSLQLAAVFVLWTPSGVVWWAPTGVGGIAAWALCVASWLFLGKAIFDAGPQVQSGAIGWWALLRGRRPDFGPMPTRGLFRACRQPIYLGFLLVLLCAPTRSPDVLLLTLVWGPYCVLAPLRKERRFQAIHGEAFARYRASVPYFLPHPFRVSQR